MQDLDDHVVAIDIGGSKICVGIINIYGLILEQQRMLITLPYDGDMIIEYIHQLLLQLKYPNWNTLRAGVTIPGLCDSENGMWIYSSFSGIKNFPIVEKLSKILKSTIEIENDVNASALAEAWCGNTTQYSHFYWITVSNGIGGAIVINNILYKGAYGYAGESGHNYQASTYGNAIVDDELENLASGSAISRQYKILSTRECVDAKEVALLAKSGDIHAQKVYHNVGIFLGKEIAHIANILNPGCIVLGGAVSLDFDLFKSSLLETYHSYRFTAATNEIPIIKSKFPKDAAFYGAAALAFKDVLTLNTNK